MSLVQRPSTVQPSHLTSKAIIRLSQLPFPAVSGQYVCICMSADSIRILTGRNEVWKAMLDDGVWLNFNNRPFTSRGKDSQGNPLTILRDRKYSKECWNE